MNEYNNNQNKFSLRRASWLTIVLAVLTVIAFFAVSDRSIQYAVPMMGVGVTESSGGAKLVAPTAVGAPMMDSSIYYPRPYNNPDVSVTDTREFLKIYYSAYMRTRDVQGLTRRVETTVKGYSGRIDQESVSTKSGYITFVVPQSKYEAFRTELESFVGSRFLTLNISSQNLLSQKVSIEEQKKQADTSLASFKTARQAVVSAYTNTVQSLQSKMNAISSQLVTLRTQTSTPQIQAQIQALTDEWSTLSQQLVNENASYKIQLSNADNNIKYAQDVQKAVATQDQALLDNIATVNGTVSVQWISMWETARLYLPGYWIPGILALLTLLSFLNDRRRFGMV